MSLKSRLIEQITLEGPLSVADYMTICLHDPQDGYYATRPAIGAEGDFITAPMISQMFGDMIGVWVAEMWHNLGSPKAFRLIEIGGGDGTLMRDVLRIAAQVPGLMNAAQVIMIEPSAPLRVLQGQHVPEAIFLPSLDGLGDDVPVIVIANEVLDCLPAQQFVRTDDGWFERCIGVVDGALSFGLIPAGSEVKPPFDAQIGDLVEVSTAQQRFTHNLALLLKAVGGAALLIDYGRAEPGPGDTLQALYRHQKHDPLAAPGEHDLTVWADFPAVAATAQKAGLNVSRITTQSDFLRHLGIDVRHAALSAKKPDQAEVLQRQYGRLMARDQMGELFKVVAMAYPANIVLSALESAPSNDRVAP